MTNATATSRTCFTPDCDTEIASHMPFCRTHMAQLAWTCDLHGPVDNGDCQGCDNEMIAGLASSSHAHTAEAARWSDASESYLVAVTCSCGNRAVGIDATPETAEREGRTRLTGYCTPEASR